MSERPKPVPLTSNQSLTLKKVNRHKASSNSMSKKGTGSVSFTSVRKIPKNKVKSQFYDNVQMDEASLSSSSSIEVILYDLKTMDNDSPNDQREPVHQKQLTIDVSKPLQAKPAAKALTPRGQQTQSSSRLNMKSNRKNTQFS